MKRSSDLKVWLVIFCLIFPCILEAQTGGFRKIRWESERIAPGLKWKSSHALLSDSVPQNINILIINLKRRDLSLYYNPSRNSPVSKQAVAAGALAAVNGGFFNIFYGGSVTYIRTGGAIVESDTARRWRRNDIMNGAVLIEKNGHVRIEKVRSNRWYDTHTEYQEVLVTGPILMENKGISSLPVTPFAVNRHPRTSVGIKGNRKVILLTVDGRTDQAAGMTLAELAGLMRSLKCRDAVNLDGGGSTTMWISGKPFNGVVNMPCDNRKFDHEGERAVSDIIIVR